ncbi:MAG: CBS domain-containing protein [Nitrospirae bacterium]|nr:CBS domain-containing protein [Nitrospirota bacterium]
MGTKIGEVLRKRAIIHVSPSQTAQDAAKTMAASKVGAAAVLEGDRLVGIVTERDIMNKVVAEGREPNKTPVESIMTRNLLLADADEDYDVCLSRMRQAGIRHLPLVKGDHLIGIVSIRDITFFEMEKKDEEIRLMNQYIHYVPGGMPE